MNFTTVIEELLEAGFWSVCIETDHIACTFNFEVYDVEWVLGGVVIKGNGDCTELNIEDSVSINYDEDFNMYIFQKDGEKISISVF